MNNNNTKEKVNNILHKLSIDFDENDLEGKTFEELKIDSLDKVELEMECELAFNLQITDKDSEKINSYNDLISYIDSKKSLNEY